MFGCVVVEGKETGFQMRLEGILWTASIAEGHTSIAGDHPPIAGGHTTSLTVFITECKIGRHRSLVGQTELAIAPPEALWCYETAIGHSKTLRAIMVRLEGRE